MFVECDVVICAAETGFTLIARRLTTTISGIVVRVVVGIVLSDVIRYPYSSAGIGVGHDLINVPVIPGAEVNGKVLRDVTAFIQVVDNNVVLLSEDHELRVLTRVRCRDHAFKVCRVDDIPVGVPAYIADVGLKDIQNDVSEIRGCVVFEHVGIGVVLQFGLDVAILTSVALARPVARRV